MATSLSLPGESRTLTSGSIPQATGTTSKGTDVRQASQSSTAGWGHLAEKAGQWSSNWRSCHWQDAPWPTALRFWASPEVFHPLEALTTPPPPHLVSVIFGAVIFPKAGEQVLHVWQLWRWCSHPGQRYTHKGIVSLSKAETPQVSALTCAGPGHWVH